MNKLAPLFVIIAAALWGVDGIVLRPELYTLPVTLVVFIETIIVALILTPFFSRNFGQFKKLKPKDWLAFIGVALFGGAIGTMAITKALFYVNHVNLSIVVLIQKLQPVFAVSFAAILLKDHLNKKFYLWAGAAIVGAYLMTFGFRLPALNASDKTSLAALFAVIATISFALSTVFSKRAIKNVDFKLATYLRFLITSGMMLIIVLSSGIFWEVSSVTSKQSIIFLIIAFTTGGPAIFFYFYGLKRISASVATICELSFPLTAIILEYILRGNILGPVQWIGVIILLNSIIRVTYLKTEKIEKPK
ncbi:MAG: DMT family transporter [Calditrichaceae bacterium]|nr:DMT family transporter [Calditrichaceae bacterium]